MHRNYSSDSLCLPLGLAEVMSPVQRWDGHAREAIDWNELKRDPELFFSHGNTLIYLYSRGRSQRGPSFRIPYDFLLYSGCRPLVEQSLISTFPTSPYDDPQDSPEYEESYLYLHAPVHLSREESFAYHVTTRNFFAWLMGVPIVGHEPVSALLALKERMDIWRDEGCDNLNSISHYIREQGYGDLSLLEVQLPPTARSTLYGDRTSRYQGVATLHKPTKRSGSVATARNAFRRRLRLSETLHHRPYLGDLFGRPQKQGDQLPSQATLREGDLATIAYEDTSAAVTPSTVWRPKPKHTRSIGRKSTYTEILVPDYGNGLSHLPPPPDAPQTTNSPPSPTSLSKTSPANAYTRRPSHKKQRQELLPPFPSPSSSQLSVVPSLCSNYSTDSPVSASPEMPLPRRFHHPFTHHDDDDDDDGDDENSTDNGDAVLLPSSQSAADAPIKAEGLRIIDDSRGETDVVIDALIGDLEAVGIGGKPVGRMLMV